MLQKRNFPVQRYVCISSRGPLPPLDLELYPRVSQKAQISLLSTSAVSELLASEVVRNAVGPALLHGAERDVPLRDALGSADSTGTRFQCYFIPIESDRHRSSFQT